MRSAPCIIVLASILWPALAAAQQTCNLRLMRLKTATWDTGVGTGYDVFDPTEYIQTQSFDVRHMGPPCSYFITFSEGNSGSFTPRHMGTTPFLRHNVYTTATKSAILKNLPSATAAEVLSGSFGNGNITTTHNYYWSIEPQQSIAMANEYADDIIVSLYSGTLTNATLEDTQSVSHSTRVRASVRASLVSIGAPFDALAQTYTMDFGVLTAGAVQYADLVVVSNDLYTVTLQSQNLQVLRHTDPAVTTTVPYTLRINGATRSLTGGTVTLVRRAGPSAAIGDRYSMQVTIGALTNPEPGTYKDNITVVVTAN